VPVGNHSTPCRRGGRRGHQNPVMDRYRSWVDGLDVCSVLHRRGTTSRTEVGIETTDIQERQPPRGPSSDTDQPDPGVKFWAALTTSYFFFEDGKVTANCNSTWKSSTTNPERRD
jgi:hypothetical protein